MNFEIPEMSENTNKAVIGRKNRKPRKAGKIRLGESLRSLSKYYTATREKADEEKHIEFYSLSDGEETFKFYDMDMSMTGVCIRNKKIAAIYMELPAEKREDFIKKLEEAEGEGEDARGMTIFSDTVTSIFVTKKEKGDKTITIALMDSEEARALSAETREERQDEPQNLRQKFFHNYFNPIGRISRKSYIPRMLFVGIPAALMFSFTWLRPELFVGELNFYILTFLVLGTLCFVSLISLAMRRMSDIGISHLYYWIFFAALFAVNQLGGKFLGDEITATRVVALIFMAAVILLAIFPGEPKKNKYGPVPKD